MAGYMEFAKLYSPLALALALVLVLELEPSLFLELISK
jgi:hypothetical protein